MISFRDFAVSIWGDEPSALLPYSQDLSRYREFQLGMALQAVAEKIDARPSEVRVVHRRPALIQELEWHPQRALMSSQQPNSVNDVLFSFYNGELFRMVVSYDPERTEGLTDQDMMDAISGTYGSGTQPPAKKILFSSSYIYNSSEAVIGRWEDSLSSLSLFRSSTQPRFGIVVLSKRLDTLAQSAILKAIKLDEQEAPQRASELLKEEIELARAAHEKARPTNKADFRP